MLPAGVTATGQEPSAAGRRVSASRELGDGGEGGRGT